MKRISLIVVISLIALTAMSFASGDGVTLRLRPNKGKTYVIFSKSSQTNVMKVQGQTIRSSQTIDVRQTFNAQDVSATQNVFETQIDAIKMSSTTMGMNFTYDSENPQNTSPMLANQAEIFNQFIKKPSTVTYNELGHNSDSGDLEMSQLSNVIIELPEGEIHVGSQWNFVKTQNVNEEDVNVTMTYTVTKISKKSVDVSFSGTIDSQDVTGTYDGTSTIDLQTGIVLAATINNSMSMTISEEGFEMPMTISGTSTISVRDQ